MFKSLYRTSFNGHFVFFHNSLSNQTIKQLSKFNFTLIEFMYDYPYINNPKIAEHIPKEPNFTPHPKTLRYFLYLAYIRAHHDQFSKIFICDSRDLIFQKNPFQKIEISNLLFCAESKEETIGSNFFNSLWIREAFGHDVLEKLSDKTIICSGTTYGTPQGMVDYLYKMVDLIKKVKDQGCKDQGIHNYLIHTNSIKDFSIVDDDKGPVSTISTFKPHQYIYINDKKQVTNCSGDVLNVVHQFDRHWKLLKKHSPRDYFSKKLDYFKQYLLAIKKSKFRKFYWQNLRSILFDPVVKKYKWQE